MHNALRKALRLLIAVPLCCLCPSAHAQNGPSQPVHSRIVSAVDPQSRVTLSGQVHPLVLSAIDTGAVPPAASMDRILLVLKRSPEQESALQTLLRQQQDPASPSYHQWLTPQQYGQQFGPSDADLAAITAWLQTSGFTGVKVNAGRTVVEFSGTAQTVQSALHTAVHAYALEGSVYTANVSEPQIPAALAPVVAGFASLNNFPRASSHTPPAAFNRDATGRLTPLATETVSDGSLLKPNLTYTAQSATYYGITPEDFATIYNINPLWSASTPIDGTGETIAVVAQSDINPLDFINFRNDFGLPIGSTSSPTGTQYLNVIHNGADPGTLPLLGETEADIDTEWAGATAKNAAIDLVVSATTNNTQGTDLSAQYVVDNNLAPVLSESFSICEYYAGPGGNAFYNNLWEQASAQGISVIVSSGNQGSEGCGTVSGSSSGNAVNAIASTPWATAVGGTDFNLPTGGSAYFSASNSTTAESALSYVPEIAMNGSCANPVAAEFAQYASLTPEQVCNSTTASAAGLLNVFGGGGGPSSCISSSSAQVNQGCAGGYAKPTWQSAPGVPADTVRDVPDVSFFAADKQISGLFPALYVYCQLDALAKGSTQDCSFSQSSIHFMTSGGTNFAAPEFAGVMALINQKTGQRQGNANPILYALANAQSTSGLNCAAASPAAGCVFHDITSGSIAQFCSAGSKDCVVTTPTDTYGILTGGTAGAGYDTATGLGSVNVANLVNSWPAAVAALTPTTTTLSLAPLNISYGDTDTVTVHVASAAGVPTGQISIIANTAGGAMGFATLDASGNATLDISEFPSGSYTVIAHYGGSGSYAQSDSAPVTLTVAYRAPGIYFNPELQNYATYITAPTASSVPYGLVNAIQYVVVSAPGQPVATGTVTLTDNGQPLPGGSSNLALSPYGAGIIDYPTIIIGSHTISGTYTPNDSIHPPSSSTDTFNVVRASTQTTFFNLPATVSACNTLTINADVSAYGFGHDAPTGLVDFYVGPTTFYGGGGTAQYQPFALEIEGAFGTIPASMLTLGSNTVTAAYRGDGDYLPSTTASTSTITVTPCALPPTSLTLTASPTTFNSSGTTFWVAAQLTNSSAAPNNGLIYLFIDGQYNQTTLTPVGGTVAQAITATLAPGQHTIYGVYSGDTNYAPATSTATTLTVTASATATTTTATVDMTGTPTGIATISPTAATGTVMTVIDGQSTGLLTTVSNGVAHVILPTTLSTGSHTLLFAYSGDATHAGSISYPISFNAQTTITPTPTFALTAAPATVSVTRGSASSAITIIATPQNGFTGTLSLSCSALPADTTCTYSPTSLTLSGSAATATVTFGTTAPSAVQAPTSASLRHATFIAFGLLSGFIFCLRRRRLPQMLPLLLASILLPLCIACGSGSPKSGGSSGGGGGTTGGTPLGTYSVQLVAISGASVAYTTVTLTVQ